MVPLRECHPIAATPTERSTDMNAIETRWTIAFRKPRANRFQRVTNWHGTWAQAYDLAKAFVEANPELQVFYVATSGMESDTILVDSGKRVRIIDNATLSGDMLDYAVSLLWDDASEDDACINEAYAGKAEDAGMSIPAYRACLSAHTANGEIFLSGLWNTPIAHMHKVVTFDDGKRYGVSNGDASFFTGDVADMPKGEVGKCVHCKSVTLTPEPVSEEIAVLNDTLAFLRTFRARAWKVYRDAENNGADMVRIEAAYGVWKDLDRSIADMRHTLSLI
jgi:hypothetical protein